MKTTTKHPVARSLSQAVLLMREQIEATLSDFPTDHSVSYVRLAVQVPPVDPLTWLQAQQVRERTFWSDRAGTFRTAGVGAALSVDAETASNIVKSFFKSDHSWPDCGPLRFFGGFRFGERSGPVDDGWVAFRGSRFILPQFELYTADDQYWFICNLASDSDHADKDKLLEKLSCVTFEMSRDEPVFPSLVSRIDSPDREVWNTGVTQALTSIGHSSLEKVVLARLSKLRFDGSLDPAVVLGRLRDRSSDCFHFLFQFDNSSAFIGASPERLFSRTGSKVFSEAVAGTRLRGDDPEHDERMAHELISSSKDIREHQFVVEDISRVIKAVCRSWKVSGNGSGSIIKLARVQHLITRLEGELKNGRNDFDILAMLHPTSAVGGTPRTDALNLIRELEPFDRGWYAGPVGWLGPDSADFAVAIRSGLVSGDELSLYAGAGIVEGSSPDEEWREVESKLANFLASLSWS